MSLPRLSVIIVNHNGKRHLEKCLHSLTGGVAAEWAEIIVVDNASTDGSREWINERFPGVRLIPLRENLGFSKANNAGLKESRGDLILFLNPDTVVKENDLAGLIETMKNPVVGAAGPLLYGEKHIFQVSFGGRRTFLRELFQKLILNPCRRISIGRIKKPKMVVWISGACLCVRREVVEAVGDFDERFFLYFEDIDLCYRIGKANWKIVLNPDVRIFHAGGTSTGAQPLKSRYYYRKSQIYFYRKHNGLFSCRMLKLYLAVVFIPLWMGGFRDRENLRLRKSFFSLLSEKE